MSWDTSTRRDRLPANWPILRRQAIARAHGRCQDTHHAAGCDGKAVEVDHIEQGDDHSPTNLQALSAACHARKTRLDNGYWAAVPAPAERHPGAL